MAKSIEKKSTQVASASRKTALNNLSLEAFEKRQEKLAISYKNAVLSENARIKEVMTTFSYLRDAVIQYFHATDSNILEKAGIPKEQVSVLMQYRQQCMSILGRLNVNNFIEVGVRVNKNGKTSIFYILQYLYKYCKEYEIKKTKQENKK